ncbi:MAG: cupin domain-containing protein [Pseudomonadota bacterium]
MSKLILDLKDSTPIRDERYGTIYELAGSVTGLEELGFAWVEVDVGAASPEHFHKKMSELYQIVEGTGIMTLDRQSFPVSSGQCVSIPPGVIHAIRNTGSMPLRFFCATSPAYNEEDDFEI